MWAVVVVADASAVWVADVSGARLYGCLGDVVVLSVISGIIYRKAVFVLYKLTHRFSKRGLKSEKRVKNVCEIA